LLSTWKGWPSTLLADSHMARRVMSLEPPAGHGTMKVMGLLG